MKRKPNTSSYDREYEREKEKQQEKEKKQRNRDDSSSDKCSKLIFPASLHNVQQPALGKLVVGNEYDVVLDSGSPKVINDDKDICGTIVSLMITDLIDCLSNGKLFRALIISNKGDDCSVKIKPA